MLIMLPKLEAEELELMFVKDEEDVEQGSEEEEAEEKTISTIRSEVL